MTEWSDGAHLNIPANDAMKAAIGGEDTTVMTDADFEQMIREAPLGLPMSDYDYGTYSNAVARIVLEAYETYPQLQTISDEHVYLQDAEGNTLWEPPGPIALNKSLYDIIKMIYEEHEEFFMEMSGFQWGWAMNAARKVLGLGAVPNPALVVF